MANIFLEKIFGALYGNTIATNQPVDLSGAPSVALPSGTTINGASATPSNITSNSATAFTVGPNGITNPSFQVDASATNAATGLKIVAKAAASGLNISVITSGTNENLKLDAAGSGTITLGSVSTGAVSVNTNLIVAPGGNPTLAASITGTITSASANVRGLKIAVTTNGAGAGSGGLEVADTVVPSGSIASYFGIISNSTAGPGAGVTITNHVNIYSKVKTNSNGGAVTNAYGMQIDVPGLGTIVPSSVTGLNVKNQGVASVTNSFGIDVAAQSGSTSNIGIRIALAGTYALQLSDTGGTAPGGITFGIDVQLWRSAATTLAVTDGIGLNTGTTTGLKIGTATSQKIGFFNAAPVVQPVASADVTGFAAGAGTASKSDSTWQGASGSSAYTVGGIITALKALGLLAA